MINTAIILAAGEGVRAWPYTGIRQKVTVPVLNTPVVRRLALDLAALGVQNFVVVIGYRGESVRACLHDFQNVRFVEQRERKGPVDAALAGLADVTDDAVIVAYADIVTSRETLRDVIEIFSARRASALLLTADCPEGLTASCTSVDVAPDGVVRGIWPRGGAKHPRFGGVVVANTEMLRSSLLRHPGIRTNVHVGSMPPAEGELADCLEFMRKDGIEIHSVHARDFFVDVDKPWHILEANAKAGEYLFRTMDKTVISQGASIDDGADIADGARLWLGPNARIGKGCHIDGSVWLEEGASIIDGAIVGRNAFIGAGAACRDYGKVFDGSVLGPNCVVGHGAEFSGVAFDTCYLYHYGFVNGILGSHVDIGAATVCGTWRFDDGIREQIIQGRKEKPECFGDATFIGDYSRTGVNAILMPGVKVGYYTCVGAGAIVYDDVPERTLLLPKQEHTLKPWGPEHYDW